MKHFFLSVFLIAAIAAPAQKKQVQTVCRSGFSYDISKSKNWGFNKPVVTTINPYSSAEKAGIKPGDIIEEIDGYKIADLTEAEISSLMNPEGKNDIVLIISNIQNPTREVIVRKECKKSNAITEEQLASAFCMYSLETTSERKFTCPFKTTVTADEVNFANYKTFAFSPIDESNRRLESAINNSIEKELIAKGLEVDTENPDMIIQTFYFFDKNPNYVGHNQVVVNKERPMRYSSIHKKMMDFPFLNISASEAEAPYLLQYGFRLIDQKEVPGRILWECESNEMLDEPFQLDEYAQIHTPLMCMQYPYVKYTNNVTFYINQKSYNYTGINYNIDNLSQIVSVDRNSPAYEAGIRAKDVVEEIGNQSIEYSAEEFTAAYKQFITNTMKYRDTKTVFTDTNGFTRCMYWDTFNYIDVSNAINKKNSRSAFAYLFNYAPYINPTGNNACTFKVRRGKTEKEYTIRPTVRKEMTIEIR